MMRRGNTIKMHSETNSLELDPCPSVYLWTTQVQIFLLCLFMRLEALLSSSLPVHPGLGEPRQRHGLHQELCSGHRTLATPCHGVVEEAVHLLHVCRHLAFLLVLSCGPRPSPPFCAVWDTGMSPTVPEVVGTPSPDGLISLRPAMRSRQLVTVMGCEGPRRMHYHKGLNPTMQDSTPR